MSISDLDLCKLAERALNSQQLGADLYVADLGCALISESEAVYTGACIGGHLGICAEQSAFSNLVSKESPRIRRLVAVWKDDDAVTHVIAPCGRCREFMAVMAPENLEADIILGPAHVVKLKDLLPVPGWHAERAF